LDLQTILHQTPTHIVLHGPVAYLETTTEDLTNDETANRVLQVRTDASEAQTKAILAAQRQRAATVPGPADQAIIARHQAAQRLLRPIPVIIPFAEQICFPTQPTRARRDHQRLLDLVCAIAFLHQYQRRHGQVHGVDVVEASPDDYDMAALLMQRCLGYAFDDLSPKARELHGCIQRMLREKAQSTVTRGDIVRWTGWSLKQVCKQLPQLTDLGYLRRLTGSKGQEYVYQLAESPQGAPSWRLGALPLDEDAANGSDVDAEGGGQNGHHPDGHEETRKGSLVQA
jgi:DNA primase